MALSSRLFLRPKALAKSRTSWSYLALVAMSRWLRRSLPVVDVDVVVMVMIVADVAAAVVAVAVTVVVTVVGAKIAAVVSVGRAVTGPNVRNDRNRPLVPRLPVCAQDVHIARLR
jgi:hypothetical protein